jgi:hypothetical protein
MLCILLKNSLYSRKALNPSSEQRQIRKLVSVLNDSASRKVILTIFQNGDAVYGTGNLNLDANTAMTAAASGTVTGDQVNLDIVS